MQGVCLTDSARWLLACGLHVLLLRKGFVFEPAVFKCLTCGHPPRAFIRKSPMPETATGSQPPAASGTGSTSSGGVASTSVGGIRIAELDALLTAATADLMRALLEDCSKSSFWQTLETACGAQVMLLKSSCAHLFLPYHFGSDCVISLALPHIPLCVLYLTEPGFAESDFIPGAECTARNADAANV